MTIGTRGKIIEFDKLPKQLGRVNSVEALYTVWRKMQASISCSPDLLRDMPKAIVYIAERFYDVEPHMAADAIRRGDPALFIAMLVRLAQIDAALVAAGKSLADRSPVIYAKHVMEGFRKVAEEAFIEMGGTPI